MVKHTKEDVLNLAKKWDVRFIRLQFTDILGIIKNVDIPVAQLEKALDGELMFDGSSIEGFVRIEESDMLLKPDPSTFTLFPWAGSDKYTTARLICDVYTTEGDPFIGCPRSVLKKVIKEAEELGYTFHVGPEPEFFLFSTDDKGRATTQTHDNAGYFDLSPVDKGEEARKEIVLTLQDMGFEIEASHHEVAPGQHEIDFKYADGISTADNIATFRFVVRTIAQKHGLHASFMPKPIFGINGSGMHLHQSLFKDGKNAFYDPNKPHQLSDDALHFIGGLIENARSFTAITNPTINSYKRLVPGYEAPVYIAWSEKNRSPLLRVPARRGIGTRVELRSPDPSCNPYLALAVTLKAGLDGIKNKTKPPKPVDQNIYEMSLGERIEQGIHSLPGSLEEALFELESSVLMEEALGQHVYHNFIEAKRIEWGLYSRQISKWEIEQYLTTF